MAIYSLSASTISRAGGKSAVAAAAYRSGASLDDERQGLRHDYRRKGGVLHAELVTPKVAPIWAGDRNRLWNEIERAEDKSTRRDTAKTARDFRLALPYELTAAERVTVSREFSQFLSERYNTAVDFAIHAPDRDGDERNYHAHVLMATRALNSDGFGAKIRSLDSPLTSGAEMLEIRKGWERIANRALEAAGHDARIDHRSNVAQGRDAEPTIHMGVAASGMERKGEVTELGTLNREIKERNAERAALKAEHGTLSAEIIDLDAERAKRAEDKAIRSAARTFEPAKIIDAMTERKSTFSRADLNYYLKDQLPDVKARSAFMDDILAHADIVPLRESKEAVVSRYTSQQVLKQEGEVFGNADRLAKNTRHGIDAGKLADVLDHHSHLDGEQRRAVYHVTKAGGFAIIAGEAGTGKSTTLAAVRDAYEGAGYRVLGTSWTNAVVDNMKKDGFSEAKTLSALLGDLEKGRDRLTPKTLLVVDEAAMLATKHLAPLMQRATEAGAKVIFAQDKKQLASIERGGIAGALEERHQPATLTKVYRARHDDDKAAMNAMHRGEFRAALDSFDKRGALHWQKDTDDARTALVSKWADDSARDPNKTRFVFAYTNAEVRELNAELRAIRKERGELGAGHELQTKEGAAAFAVGDRIQITGNDRDRDRRAAGLFNGSAGTIADIRNNRVTVTLDGAKDAAPRQVSFIVGEDTRNGEFNAFRHGYAGTIYKGQGKTLDESYLLHSEHWRAASSYVALSRHRETTNLFAAEKPAAWMMAEGGLEALTAKHRESAERSYSAWAEAKPELAAKYDLANYVGYVQDQWQTEKHLDRLDRLASQMGRVEENRAASQFVQGAAPRPADEAPKPPIYGRYGELKALQKRLAEAKEAREASPAPQSANDAAKAAQRPMAPAERLAADMRALTEGDKSEDSSRTRTERDTGRDPADERGYQLPDRMRTPTR